MITTASKKGRRHCTRSCKKKAGSTSIIFIPATTALRIFWFTSARSWSFTPGRSVSSNRYSRPRFRSQMIQKGARSPHTLTPSRYPNGTRPGSTIGGGHVLAEPETLRRCLHFTPEFHKCYSFSKLLKTTRSVRYRTDKTLQWFWLDSAANNLSRLLPDVWPLFQAGTRPKREGA